MNYAQLKTAVADTAKRPDLVAVIPSFIRMAHGRLCAEVQPPDSLVNVEVDTSLATNESGTVWAVNLPADCLEVRSVRSNDWPLPNHNESSLYAVFGKGGGGQPQGYSVRGLTLLLAPGAGSHIRLSYNKMLPQLEADTDTNWLLTNMPDTYLYASLVHLNEYIQDAEQVSACEALYLGIAQLAREQLQQLKQGGNPVIRGA